jgi:TetR/AcrR family transcriptional regulator, lmrAB and yxaGH operons repressor
MDALAADTKQRMIELTAALLARKGLQGTSFKEILDASGAPRGSLYHHFPGGKAELILAALGFAGDQALKLLEAQQGKPATDIARAFVGMWRTVLEKSKFGAGCTVAAVTVAAEEPALLERAGEVLRNTRLKLADLLADGGVPARRALPLAISLLAACEGAVVLSRAEQSMEPLDLVAQEQIAAIKAAMKGSAGPRQSRQIASLPRR